MLWGCQSVNQSPEEKVFTKAYLAGLKELMQLLYRQKAHAPTPAPTLTPRCSRLIDILFLKAPDAHHPLRQIEKQLCFIKYPKVFDT